MLRITLFIFSFFVASIGFAAEEKPLSEKQIRVNEFNHAVRTSRTLVDEGDWSGSLPFAKSAIELGQSILADKPDQLAALEYNYGVLLKKVKDYTAAYPQLLIALKQYEKLYGKAGVELLALLSDVGHVGARLNERSVVKKLKRATKIASSHFGRESIEHGEKLYNLGVIQYDYFHEPRAEKTLQRSYEIFKQVLGEEAPYTGLAAYQLGRISMSKRKHDQSLEYLEKALQTFEQPEKPSGRMELMTHAFLVEAYENLDQSDEATKHCLAIGRMTPVVATQDYLPLFKKAPKYPRSALHAGKDGWVIVEFDVDQSGFVINPRVVDRHGPRSLEDSSIAAAKKFRYAPAFVDGEAVVTRGVQNRLVYAIQN